MPVNFIRGSGRKISLSFDKIERVVAQGIELVAQ